MTDSVVYDCRTTVSSSGSAVVDDDVGGTVKHVRTYQVYRGMSPEAVSRLEVCRSITYRRSIR